MFCKGAPEGVLDCCTFVCVGTQKVPLTAAVKDKIMSVIRQYSSNWDMLRCLGLATIDNTPKPEQVNLADSTKFHSYEVNMTFVGVAGMLDPPRKEVCDSVKRCRAASILVIVIIGDNKASAEAICRHIGVFEEDENLIGLSYSGREFDELSPKE